MNDRRFLNCRLPNFRSSVVLGLSLLCTFAPQIASASALEQLKNFVSATRSASGEFSQRLQKADSSKVSNPASGTFLFARPGKFIWTYTKPYAQVLQADGEKLYIYDQDLNQVTIKKLGSALGSSPAAILFGSNDQEKNFTQQEAGVQDGLEWLSATPKARDTTFDSIRIGFKDNLPMTMELHDSFGQISLLQFRQFNKNPLLQGDPFRFITPKGADVIGP